MFFCTEWYVGTDWLLGWHAQGAKHLYSLSHVVPHICAILIHPPPPPPLVRPFTVYSRRGLTQLWVVFKRYREFVALRQLLKTACQQNKNPASSSGRSRSPARAKLPFAAASGSAAAESRAGGGNVVTSKASAERIEKILSTFRFPHKLAIGRSAALREERRKALNAFLGALVSGWGLLVGVGCGGTSREPDSFKKQGCCCRVSALAVPLASCRGGGLPSDA